MIGSVLDKYEVLEKVGEGGMATVYRGRHATLNRTVAIKVLHPHLSSSTRNRKRFAREARAIEHLRHPNVLEIYDYSGVDAGDCYIVTEFVTGETLSALLWRRGRLPSEVAALIALDLALALAYAHRESILHRDLKPDNVMIRTDGTVKLMDFGIARFLDESQVTMTGALVGSPAYMSPEQARQGKLDRRSDLFSLGTLLFQSATGQLPFSGGNPSLILRNIVEGNRPTVAELAPAISPALGDVIERLMASQPEARFDSAEAVALAVEGVLAESGIDRNLPEWSVASYLSAPEAWEQQLEAHLRIFLLARGKGLLEAGDHLAALRLFNRLLSMDSENPEVLALVSQLHGAARPKRRVGVLLGATTLGVLACALIAAYAIAPSQRPVAVSLPTPPTHEGVAKVAALAPPRPVPLDAPAPAGVEATPPTPPLILPRPVPRPVGLPPTPEVLTAPAPAPALYGTVVIVTNGLVADVYSGSRKVGQTGREIELTQGTYSLRIESEGFEPVETTVTITPTERITPQVSLRPKPRFLILRGFSDLCLVDLNGAAQGTVSRLGARVEVKRPDDAVDLVVTCDRVPKRFAFSRGSLYLGDKTVFNK